MHEGSPGHEEADRQRLIHLLRSDFTSPEEEEQRQEYERKARETGNALSAFLSHVQVVDDDRFASEENLVSAQEAVRLLDGAAITPGFKLYIGYELRKAHGYREPVDEGVSPEALGLVDGPGIFSPERAPSIEARTLREFLHRASLYSGEDLESFSEGG